MWNILKEIRKGDYVYALVPDHPKATKNGYVLYHRVVMENAIGRLLTDNEEVHHIDRNRYNNDLSNLQLLTKEEHKLLHIKERTRKYIELICPICGKSFIIPESQSFMAKKDKTYTCCSLIKTFLIMDITTIIGIIGAIIFGAGLLLLLFDHYSGALLWIVSIILFTTNACIEVNRKPTFSDVNEGKAVYQETLHMKITGNDTVSWRTYKIVWLDERD